MRWRPAPQPLIAAGYSFGAAAALRTAGRDPTIARVIAVAPPLGLIDEGTLAAIGCEVHVLVGDEDVFAPLPDYERRLSALRGLRLRVLPGVDHFFSWGAAEVEAWAEQAVR